MYIYICCIYIYTCIYVYIYISYQLDLSITQFDKLFATHATVTINTILQTEDPAISTRLQPLAGPQKSSSFQVNDVQFLKP